MPALHINASIYTLFNRNSHSGIKRPQTANFSKARIKDLTFKAKARSEG